ncbi:YqjK family protein [Undibacterium sp.]|jgi:hypothetical protein|uniref:YqjK family protein n=1 Tax=Undibacterium sp. TaxID=1914977 RepID=UPI002B9724F9|nr:YqjK family protein [Undibacterium sp.]HTD05534.1 YqjK family protein [Undibacterium sp.]
MAPPSLSGKLEQRRNALLAKSQQQRDAFQLHAGQARQSLAIADIGLRIVNQVKQHPLIVAGVVAAAVVVKPRKLFSLLNKGLIAWRIWQSFRPGAKPAAGTAADRFTD